MLCFGCNTELTMVSKESPQYGAECYDDIIEYKCPECDTTYTVHVKRGNISKWRQV